MKTKNLISTFTMIVLAVVFLSSNQFAQNETKQERNQIKNQVSGQIQHGYGFVDLNGDGFNDNAPDIDGDGIPNGQDPDYVRPQDGTGQKKMYGKNSQTTFGGNKYGPGKGTGNNGIGPRNGSGNGPGSGSGTGICDGSGPHGNRGGRK